MGCDGGSIPRRIEMVKTKAKTAEKTEDASLIKTKWTTCALSKRPLSPPIVGCALGRLYNKDAVYEFLLDPKSHGDGDIICAHVKKPKDVVTLSVRVNPAYKPTMADSVAQFVCPLSMKEMNGTTRFCFLWTCGCVMSEQALNEFGGSVCLQCNKLFDKDRDVVIINPTGDDLKRQECRVQDVRTKTKEKKKRKHAEPSGSDSNSMTKPITDDTMKKARISIVKDKKELSHLADAVPKIIQAKKTSAAIGSLYKSNHPSDNSNNNNNKSNLFSGTFTRYAAG